MIKTLLRRKGSDTAPQEQALLQRQLSSTDLILFGIGAIIGAGIFVITGVVAATQTGPAIILSYLLAGIACACAALSYAELAASIGGCGSAYGYAYTGFGELIAWVVGWDLLLEYAMSIAAVSVGWSGYCNDLLSAIGIHLPLNLLKSPLNGGILDVLSLFIVMALTLLLLADVKSNARINNVIVGVKLLVIALFIGIAITAVNPQHWVPFMPFGWAGVFNGASLIFFAYVGFDAISTTAEEAILPQRDLPRGILGSLAICTILYIVVAILLTGIVPYTQLNVSSPISHALMLIGYQTAAGIIGVGALAGLTTVMLVLFYGLSRIFLSMARDGLLPSFFARTHAKTKAPMRIILSCGGLIAASAALLPLKDLAELVNIGTLVAFASVCLGVLILRYKKPTLERPFKTPCMPYVPIVGMLSCGYLIVDLPWVTLLRFVIWLLVGFVVYFSYSMHHSVLANHACQAKIKDD